MFTFLTVQKVEIRSTRSTLLFNLHLSTFLTDKVEISIKIFLLVLALSN
jgi:hypothetical protein